MAEGDVANMLCEALQETDGDFGRSEPRLSHEGGREELTGLLGNQVREMDAVIKGFQQPGDGYKNRPPERQTH